MNDAVEKQNPGYEENRSRGRNLFFHMKLDICRVSHILFSVKDRRVEQSGQLVRFMISRSQVRILSLLPNKAPYASRRSAPSGVTLYVAG